MSYELNKKIRELEPYEPISGTYKIRLDAKRMSRKIILNFIQRRNQKCN